jgi:putative oxidoreductase
MNQKSKLIESIVALLVRLSFGGMMLAHGIPKMDRLFGDEPIKFANILGVGPEISLALAVFSEVICALLVVFGYRTRWTVLPLIVTMLVAAFYIHWGDPFGDMEMALLYLAGYLAVWVNGSGNYSVDALLAGRNRQA